jgi:DNA polymerase III subunit gamma/tau
LLNEVHRLTLAKVGGPADPSVARAAREEIEERSNSLSFPMLHRLWQLLLKGHDEVAHAAMPREAADMALLRVTHAATMPDPGELARMIQSGDMPSGVGNSPSSPSTHVNSAPAAEAAGPIMPSNFDALLSLLVANGHHSMEIFLRDELRVIEFAPPKITFQLASTLKSNPIGEIRETVSRLTGAKWDFVEDPDAQAPPSERELAEAIQLAEDSEILNSPLVKAARAAFPAAEVTVEGRQIRIDATEDPRSASA